MSDFQMPQPRQGDEVFWYAQAERNNKPDILKVTEVGHDGIAGLLIRHNCPSFRPIHGVKHIDDPFHRLSPRPVCSLEQGGWCFKPWDMPSSPDAAPTTTEAAPLEPDDIEEVEVLHLRFNKKLPPSVIAARMGKTWTTATVKEVLEKYTAEQAQALLLEKMPAESAVLAGSE